MAWKNVMKAIKIKLRWLFAVVLIAATVCRAGAVYVQGTLRDSDGAAVPHVMVRLYCGSKPYGGDPAADIYSWSGNFYLFADRFHGPVVLTAQKDGYGDWRYRWEEDELDDVANITIDPVLVAPCTVSGRVHNAAQEGLPDVAIKLDWVVGDGVIEYETVSGVDGVYTIPGVGTGSYTAIILPPEPYADVVTPIEVPASGVLGRDFELPVGAMLSGTVTARVGGEPLDGVTVTITGPMQQQTQTEPDGGYEFRLLAPGTYLVDAQVAGFCDASATVALEPGGHETLDLEMQRPATLHAEVRAPDGSTVAGAAVGIRMEPGDAAATWTATSGLNGTCTLAEIVPGERLLQVNYPFYGLARQSVTLPDGGTVTQVVHLASILHLTGQVRERGNDHHPIEGVSIELFPAGESGVVYRIDSTDAFGRYHLRDLESGDYTLQATHAGYHPVETNVTVSASIDVPLDMLPLPDRVDVYVQVHCAVSGLPVAGTDVELDITALPDGGATGYEGVLTTDDGGNVFFPGVAKGHARFRINRPDGNHCGWWHEFETDRAWIGNDKLVNIRLEPRKSQLIVHMRPPFEWMNEMPVYVQNFWIEVQGFNPGDDQGLYPARTGLTDKDGIARFFHLPSLPVRVTVRRPGFTTEHHDLSPDADGVFPSPLEIVRPEIAAGTRLRLFFDQPVFNYLLGTTAMPIQQHGIDGSNTEGFDEFWSVAQTWSLPFRASTAYGPRSPWGAGTYLLSPRPLDAVHAFGQAQKYQPGVDGLHVFEFAFDFDPHHVTVTEGVTKQHWIAGRVVPARYHGTLLAVDTCNEAGEPLMRPRPHTEIRFVIHENFSDWYTESNQMHSVTTDDYGNYTIEIPPGRYGIEIPDLPGYWGQKLLIQTTGDDMVEHGWPYAFIKPEEWRQNAYNSPHFRGSGLYVRSAADQRLDLVVRKQVYVVGSWIGETDGTRSRLIFMEPDGTRHTVPTADLLEIESEIMIEGNGKTFSAPVRKHNDGMRAIWTNLPPATYTYAGTTHPYVTSDFEITFDAFDWGAYPGAMPTDEPPLSTYTMPLPMRYFSTGQSIWFSDADAKAVSVTVIYLHDGDLREYTTSPQYFEYTDWPGRRFVYQNRVNPDRAAVLYIKHKRNDQWYAATRSGNDWIADARGPSATVNPGPYNLTVIARHLYTPTSLIPDLPFDLLQDGVTYQTPHQFNGLTGSAALGKPADIPSAWEWFRVDYETDVSGGAAAVLATIRARPLVDLTGVLKHAGHGDPIRNAAVRLVRADGSEAQQGMIATEVPGASTDHEGRFTFNTIRSGMGPYVIETKHPGYFPTRTRIVLHELLTGSHPEAFTAALDEPIPLTPIAVDLDLVDWNRHGSVLHAVRSAGADEAAETEAALTLTLVASTAVEEQTFDLLDYDDAQGQPGAVQALTLTDALETVWLVDARWPDADSGRLISQLPADAENYFPKSLTHLPRPDDPDGIDAWMHFMQANFAYYRRYEIDDNPASAVVTGQVNVSELPPGDVHPVLTVVTRNGGRTILSLGTDRLHSVALPRWLAFASDIFAMASTVQGTVAELKETYASKQPDGKLAALPMLSGGIEEENGYLRYNYGVGVSWKEGANAPGEGGLSIGPGVLGLEFQSEAAIGFDGQSDELSFEVGGSIGREDIELTDYMPRFARALGVEGAINQISGMAETTRSGAFDGGEWTERELKTMVGASIDLMLRYNLEGITGRLPYVGPFITAADRSGLLQLFARLDAGGRVETSQLWRTIEPERVAVGEEWPDGYIIPDPEAQPVIPARHAFGGATEPEFETENEFALGLTFASSFEGSALNDALSLQVGLEITGNESDLVAGQPSLVILPNLSGNYPPIMRASGDVNAFANAKLDLYITEIEKNWTMNLARLDYQFGTSNLMTMADLTIQVKETPRPSTEFDGTFPILTRNVPSGSSYAVLGDRLVFGMFDAATQTTRLMLSRYDGEAFEPATALATVEGLGLIRLTDLGAGRLLLVWEERPGFGRRPTAGSIVKASFFEDDAWSEPQTALVSDGTLVNVAVFMTGERLSIVSIESPEGLYGAPVRVRAFVFDPEDATWSLAHNIRSYFTAPDSAMACVAAGIDGTWSDEPGRIVYIQSNHSVSSRYWDGDRIAVPGKLDYSYIAVGPIRRIGICAQGTSGKMFLALAGNDGRIRLRRYTPDPERDPGDPDYDWNGRTAAAMWPDLGVLEPDAGAVDDLACAWLPGPGLLLTVWSRNGSLACNFTDPDDMAGGVSHPLSSNIGGIYSDVKIQPDGPDAALILARFQVDGNHELRVFRVSPPEGLIGPDPDIYTLVYRGGVAGEIIGVATQQVAMGHNGSAVEAVRRDDTVVFQGWSDGRTDNPRTDRNVRRNMTVRAVSRTQAGADPEWYANHGYAPGDGQTWSDLDHQPVPGKNSTLRKEYFADTNPNDRTEWFRVQALVVDEEEDGWQRHIHFQSSAGRVYTLYRSADPGGDDWEPVSGQGPRPGVGGPDQMIDTDPVSPVYYRMKVGLPQ